MRMFEMLARGLCACLMIYVFIPPSVSFSESDLSFVIDVQNLFCEISIGCENNTLNTWNNSRSLPVHPRTDKPDTCCKLPPCSCDTDTCHVTGSCCPETLQYLPTVEESLSIVKPTCAYPQLRYPQLRPHSPRVASARKALLMYRKCLPIYKNTLNNKMDQMQIDNINKCEHNSVYEDIDTKIPVTENGTLLHFQNRYCARCHGVSEQSMIYWDMKVVCLATDSYLPTSLNRVASEIVKTVDCNLIYEMPETIRLSSPQAVSTCKNVIHDCNVTGHWLSYDPVIAAACLAYTSLYNTDYNNVFCYMCNTRDTVEPKYCNEIGSTGRISFSALLKFIPDQQSSEKIKRKDVACNTEQMYDAFKGICRDVTCMPPKSLNNGTCVNIIKTLSGVSYAVFLKMTPTTNISIVNLLAEASDLQNYVENLLRDLSLIHITFKLNLYFESGMNSFYNTSDTFVNYFVVHFELFVPVLSPVDVSLLDAIIAMDETIQTVTKMSGNNTITYKTELDTFIEEVSHNESVLLDLKDNTHLQGVVIDPYLAPYIRGFLQVPPIILTRLHVCPCIHLNSSEFHIVTYAWGIFIEELEMNIFRNKYSEMPQTDTNITSVLICVETYKPIAEKIAQYNRNNDNIYGSNKATPQGILTIVCTCLSLVGSVLTLMTYVLFKELRTQPGVNNMALTICLLCAQALFQFGIGQMNEVSTWACQLMGILIHYFWLMVVLWMNVCSYHMCKVFYNLNKTIHGSGIVKKTLYYFVYCSVTAAIPVIINIAVELTLSGGTEMGYGAHSCYISRYNMVGYTFALPLGIVILANIVMFIIVIVQVTRMPSVNSSMAQNRNYAIIYVKLSSLTGLTWIFGFLFFFTDITAFEYLFIILNGGQGVFIFIAFICNKRVFRLYAHIKSILSANSSASRRTKFSDVKSTTTH